MSKTSKGSRKHIINLVDTPHYQKTLNALLAGHASVTSSDKYEPSGNTQASEREVPSFCRKHCPGWFDLDPLEGWWLPAQRRRPRGATWDLLSTCSVGSDGDGFDIRMGRGLLLVEAKAHEKELGNQGKILNYAAKERPQSRINHDHITACLTSVTQKLQEKNPAFSLGVDSHYQLANRIAWAWKLAECGVPVVLLYLGFTGDTGFTDHLKDADHWQSTMEKYLKGVVPDDLPGRRIAGCNGGSFTLLVRSLPV